MPLEEFFAAIADEGVRGKGWRSFWALLGLGIGAVLGGWLGYQTGISAMIWQAGVGALIGWGLGVLLRGLFRFIALMIVFGVVVVAWYYVTGRFG